MTFQHARAAALCAASATLIFVAAHAETPDDPFAGIHFVPADERSDPLTDPVPFPVGIFYVQPSVDFTAGLTTNLFATDGNSEQASHVGFAPALAFESRWTRHGLNGRLQVDHLEISDFPDESRTNVLLGLDGHLDLGAATRLSAAFLSEDRTEARTAFSNIATSLEPNEYSRLAAGLGLTHQSGKWRTEAQLDLTSFDHDDVEVPGDLFQDQDFRDRDEVEGRLRLAYAVNDTVAAYGEATHAQASFDPPGFFNAFNRDYAGTTLSVGSVFTFGDHVQGDIGIGYLSYSFDDPSFADIDDVTVSGTVQWLLASATTLETSVTRGVINPGLLDTIAATETGADLRLVHGITPRLSLVGAAGFNTYEFENLTRTDDRVDVLLGANWKLSKSLWLESHYEMLDSSSPVQAFTDNRVMFRMRVFP